MADAREETEGEPEEGHTRHIPVGLLAIAAMEEIE
jgi:hypothetical protein